MTEALIRIDNIHKSYLMGKEAVPALRGVSLDIEQGEFVCLMGPSGSGKTTLLNIIGGLDEPSRGHVTIDGENLVALSENQLATLRLHKMGFIFQTFGALPISRGTFSRFPVLTVMISSEVFGQTKVLISLPR